jgi:hypothetical protein
VPVAARRSLLLLLSVVVCAALIALARRGCPLHVVALQKRNTIVSVEEDWVVMFTPAFRATGREDAVITVAMPPEHLRLSARGVRTIASHDPVYAHAESPSVR